MIQVFFQLFSYRFPTLSLLSSKFVVMYIRVRSWKSNEMCKTRQEKNINFHIKISLISQTFVHLESYIWWRVNAWILNKWAKFWDKYLQQAPGWISTTLVSYEYIWWWPYKLGPESMISVLTRVRLKPMIPVAMMRSRDWSLNS